MENTDNSNNTSIWKNNNQQYIFELQKFMDLADNIQDEELRKLIIYQMLRCDNCVTKIAEDIFKSILNDKKRN